MSKKKNKKQKVVKLSDEDYNAYIMALKDEKPPKLVKDTQEKRTKIFGSEDFLFFSWKKLVLSV